MKYLLIVVACITCCCNWVWCADNDKSWRLSTDDTTLTVTVKHGVPFVTHLGSTKGASEWLLAPAPETLLTSVTQQGSSLATKWHYEGGAFDPQSGKLILRFSNSAPAMELQSIWRARPGRGPIEHWLTIANHSGGTITIGQDRKSVV